MKPKVFFHQVNENNIKEVSEIALKLLKKTISEGKIKLGKEIPLKIHSGAPGNISFIRQQSFLKIIEYLKQKNIKTYYLETNQAAGGERAVGSIHRKIAKANGFSKIPFIVADGEDGFDHVLVRIKGGKYFKECKIASKLADKNQIIVLSHFKGHVMSGFGGAIKMLSLGFASGRGKVEIHSKVNLKDGEPIPWSKIWTLFIGKDFRERTAEYALAASQNKQFIYISYALNLVKDCDCDGKIMKPLYKDLGVFASTDPVAIDKAVFDILARREGKKPYSGDDIFHYCEKIGLGSQKYELVDIG